MDVVQLRNYVRELRQIERACLGDTEEGGPNQANDEGLDRFQRNKRDLLECLDALKERVDERNKIVARVGRDARTVRMRGENSRELTRAQRLLAELEAIALKDLDRAQRRKRGAMPLDKAEARVQVVDLFRRDMADVAQRHTEEHSRAQGAQGDRPQANTRAQQLREERRRKRQAAASTQDVGVTAPSNKSGVGQVEMQPLTQQEMQFLREAEETNQVIDTHLEDIHHGVRRLGALADDIGTELKVQDKMLNKLESKMEETMENYRSANTKMKELLDASGGMARWCPIMICVLIAVAAAGFLFDTVL